MNSKDYKEIARIIKGCHVKGDLVINELLRYLANRLASYFEREERGRKYEISGKPFLIKFNQQQFLKNCGVDK